MRGLFVWLPVIAAHLEPAARDGHKWIHAWIMARPRLVTNRTQNDRVNMTGLHSVGRRSSGATCSRRANLGRVGGPCSLLCVLLMTSGACSLRSMAVNAIVPTLADPTVYLSAEDPELVRESLPFLLKTMESILTSSPAQRDALLSACQGFHALRERVSPDGRKRSRVGGLRGCRGAARSSRSYVRAGSRLLPQAGGA